MNGKAGYILVVFLCVVCLIAGASISSLIKVAPNAADYIVDQKDGKIYAQDKNGAVAFSGDDAAAVINEALSSGNYVFIKSGRYNITHSIIVYSHTILEGEGGDDPALGKSNLATRLVRSPTLQSPLIEGSDVYDLVIKNLAIDGARTNRTDTPNLDGIRLDVVKRSRLEGLSVYDCMGNGVCLTGAGSIENRILYCTLRHNNMNGLLQQLQSDSTVAYCELGGNGYDGLRMYTAGNNLIEGCTVFLNKGCGIRLTDAPQNRIVDNRINTNTQDGIRLSVLTEGGCDKNVVSQNTIYDNGYQGGIGYSAIALNGGNQTGGALPVRDCIVSNNQAFNTKDWGTPQSYGIREYGENSGNTILGDTCKDNVVANIKTVGLSTKCGDCWNGTAYVK